MKVLIIWEHIITNNNYTKKRSVSYKSISKMDVNTTPGVDNMSEIICITKCSHSVLGCYQKY